MRQRQILNFSNLYSQKNVVKRILFDFEVEWRSVERCHSYFLLNLLLVLEIDNIVRLFPSHHRFVPINTF